ncbi:MAG: HIRAN domain-containing protein, partial [Longicatena sp.]
MGNITIVGAEHYFGTDIFRVDQIVYLVKDVTNEYDEEAIKVVLDTGVSVGYVANSVFSKAKGTKSAGRLYDAIKDKRPAKILFIVKGIAIAKVEE